MCMSTGHLARSARPERQPARGLRRQSATGPRRADRTSGPQSLARTHAPTIEIRELHHRDAAYLALLELAVADDDWEQDEATTMYGAEATPGATGERPCGPVEHIEAMVDELVLAVAISAALQFIAVSVPCLEVIFKTVTLNLNDWLLVIAVSSLPLWLMEVVKLFLRRRAKE